jgi:hypothetical protein
MPKEMKVETVHATISSLTDEQLQAMVHELQERIAAKLSCEDAKVISAEASPALTTLPQPTRYRRPPKSSPERLAQAREYMRSRRAADKVAKQKEKTAMSPSSPPAPPTVD